MGFNVSQIINKILPVKIQEVDGNVSVQLTGGKAKQAIVITVDADITPTSGITVNIDTDATVIFEGDTTAVAVKLIAGAIYPYSIKKVTIGEGILGLY